MSLSFFDDAVLCHLFLSSFMSLLSCPCPTSHYPGACSGHSWIWLRWQHKAPPNQRMDHCHGHVRPWKWRRKTAMMDIYVSHTTLLTPLLSSHQILISVSLRYILFCFLMVFLAFVEFAFISFIGIFVRRMKMTDLVRVTTLRQMTRCAICWWDWSLAVAADAPPPRCWSCPSCRRTAPPTKPARSDDTHRQHHWLLRDTRIFCRAD